MKTFRAPFLIGLENIREKKEGALLCLVNLEYVFRAFWYIVISTNNQFHLDSFIAVIEVILSSEDRLCSSLRKKNQKTKYKVSAHYWKNG